MAPLAPPLDPLLLRSKGNWDVPHYFWPFYWSVTYGFKQALELNSINLAVLRDKRKQIFSFDSESWTVWETIEI